MGWRCEWRVTCDQCGIKGKSARTSEEAEKKSLKDGWIAWEGFYGRFHACCSCKDNLSTELAASLADSNEVRR